MPQRLGRIHAGSSRRRNVTGDQRYRGENRQRGRDRQGIERAQPAVLRTL